MELGGKAASHLRKEEDVMPVENQLSNNSSKLAAGINFLLGIWMFISPWVYGAAGTGSAWNSWIVGALIAIVAAFGLSNSREARSSSWTNTILGGWLFFSPWIFAYTGNTGRFINSLCVGVVIVVLSIYSASARPRHITGTP